MTARSHPNTKNPLEWFVFGTGTILVSAAIAFLIQLAIQHDDSPADLYVAIEKIESTRTTTVTLAVKNEGSKTASEVQLEVTATFPDGEKQSSVAIDFVPKKGSRTAYAVFDSTIAPASVTARVLGYVEP